jgi:hypothetical protein
MTEIPNHRYRLLMPVIKMEDLKDEAYYIGKSHQRGMPIGKWDAKKKKFLCIKPPTRPIQNNPINPLSYYE